MNQEKTQKKNQNKENDEKYYKGRYHIVYYGEDDETYITGFNTIIDICRYKKLKVTTTNINQMHVELYRALKRPDHMTRMLDGKVMHVYLVDMIEKEEE